MFKTIVAATAVATVNAAVNGDFLSGMQTGAFTTSFVAFEDYNCPMPELSEKVENYLNMYNTAKTMMGGKKSGKNSKASEESDMLDKVDQYVDQIGVLVSVMDNEYDGGDFCAGLTVGFEGRQVGQAAIINAVKGAFNGKVSKN